MKLIIAGGRDFDDLTLALTEFYDFSSEMNVNLSKSNPFKEIVSGGARGADRIGEMIAEINKIPVKQFIPDWDSFGKRAGFVRNADMGDYADAALIFWDGKSKGTANMIEVATKKGIPVKVVEYGRDILTFTTPEHRWLSNMVYVDIMYDRIIYPSVENFYQAMKYHKDDVWNEGVSVRHHISKLKPSEAKKFSKENPMTNPKFEKNKLEMMKWANQIKFHHEPFKSKLLNTYNAHLEEGNWWGDKFWGTDIKTREGENNLGKILMEIRDEIRSKTKQN